MGMRAGMRGISEVVGSDGEVGLSVMVDGESKEAPGTNGARRRSNSSVGGSGGGIMTKMVVLGGVADDRLASMAARSGSGRASCLQKRRRCDMGGWDSRENAESRALRRRVSMPLVIFKV